jgi:ribosome-associated protein
MAEEKTGKITSKRSLPREVKISIKASKAKKAESLVVLDLRGISSFTDYFVIMHGNSVRQNLALHDSIEKELRKENIRPLSVEGKEHAEWILMDYGDFIVHIFSERTREYYSLEKLWGDAHKLSY